MSPILIQPLDGHSMGNLRWLACGALRQLVTAGVMRSVSDGSLDLSHHNSK